MGADEKEEAVKVDIAAAMPENADQLKRIGLGFILAGLTIWLLPHFFEFVVLNWVKPPGSLGMGGDPIFGSALSGDVIWVCFLLMLAFVSLGIALFFAAYMGLSVVLEINNPFSAKGVAKVGNAFAAFLILVTGAYFATAKVHEPMQERRSKADQISKLKEDIKVLEDDRAKLKAALKTFEPYKQFVSYLLKEDGQNPGMRISTKIGRETAESWRPPKLIDGRLIDEETLAGRIGSEIAVSIDENALDGFAVTTTARKLFFWDNKRNLPISYLNIEFSDGFKLDVDFVIYDAFCEMPEPSDLNGGIELQAGPIGGLEKEG